MHDVAPHPLLMPYPGTALFDRYRRDGRLLTTDWEKYNGATVVFQPKRMAVAQLRHAQMTAFHEFYTPRSALRRLGAWPVKRNSWLANLSIYRGLTYYYGRRRRPAPRFADLAATDADADARIAASLGEAPPARCGRA